MCLIGLLGDVSVTSRRRTTIQNRIKCCLFDHSRRKQQDSRCFHHSSHQVSSKSDTMFSSSFLRLILLLCLLSSSFSSTASSSNYTAADQTLRPQEELQKLKLIRQELDKINKPAVRTIQAISLFIFVNLINVYYTDLLVDFITLFLLCFVGQLTCKFCYSVLTLFFLLCFFSMYYVCRAQMEM